MCAKLSPGICLLVVLATIGVAVFPTASEVSAATIVSDTFTAANSTALIGRLPSPIDIPANVYAGNGNVSIAGGITGGTPYQADIQSNAVRLGADAGLAVNLSILNPAQFQLSITFNISGDSETQANNTHRGAALGFFSSVALGTSGSSHGYNNFTGLSWTKPAACGC